MKPGHVPTHQARIWAAFLYSSIFQARDPVSEQIAAVHWMRYMTTQLHELTESLKAWGGR